MPSSNQPIDVLCAGHASYDLVFSVASHPAADEKITADDFINCGGGPAANAAVAVARLGYQSAFAGYLSHDIYGEKHYQELVDHGIDTKLIVRGQAPTPISTIIVKPNGNRALINYKGATQPLAADAIGFSDCSPKTILFDGHEPNLSIPLMELARSKNIPTILDAGSVHKGTLALMQQVDYLACSEKFAIQYAGDAHLALQKMAQFAPAVIITLGNKGLIWQRRKEQGSLPAYSVDAADTTGAGDAFHGALAAGVAANMDWLNLLKYASTAGALCCTKTGARPGLPTRQDVQSLLN